MSDMTRIIALVKQAAREAVEAAKPAGVQYGTVVGAQPLKIQTEQKLTLGVAQLTLCRSVTDHTVEITWGGERRSCTVHNALQAGERVMLLQQQGGQKYIVIDRV